MHCEAAWTCGGRSACSRTWPGDTHRSWLSWLPTRSCFAVMIYMISATLTLLAAPARFPRGEKVTAASLPCEAIDMGRQQLLQSCHNLGKTVQCHCTVYSCAC